MDRDRGATGTPGGRCEIGDPCWEALALRGLALDARRPRRTDRARDLLAEAVASCRRLPDVYKWAEVAVLGDLLELDPAGREAEPARALGLATTAPCGPGPGARRRDGGAGPP